MDRQVRAKQSKSLRDLHLYQCVLLHRYEILKGLGDGSFGTVSLGRKRKLGSAAPLVAIKSMKKPIDPPQDCLKLREVQSLHVIPQHPAIVPVLESFYDPSTRLFHMVMEHMEQNLYQLIKSRSGQCFELHSVKSILTQILDGLQHCHKHDYFHRDIKPENILVTCSHKQGPATPSSISKLMFRPAETSRFITPPATPIEFCVKLADFGLAREIHSEPPYTVYVSTRWYRAPEVLLRAGKYSAPVDMWAFGAMAVEVATLKPLFPGSHEVDQMWRICEVMGSPGDWHNDSAGSIGGGVWNDGYKLAEKLGFTFPKTPPKIMETILGKSWPASFADLVTKLLSWDPALRPTSTEALRHDLFRRHDIRPDLTSPKTTHGYRASLLPWVDHANVAADSLNNFPDSVHESLHRRLLGHSDKQPQSELSHQAWAMQPVQRQPIDTDLTSSSPHRQSWFARKRNSIIGRGSRAPRDDASQPLTPDRYRSSFDSNHERLITRPLYQRYASLDEEASIPMLPPIRHSSPLQDTSPVISEGSNYRIPPLLSEQRRQLAVSQVQAGAGAAHCEQTGISLRTPISHVNTKMGRSISENSTEQCSALQDHQARSLGHGGGSHSSLGSLFAHLRKKHKRSEQNQPEPKPELRSPLAKTCTKRALVNYERGEQTVATHQLEQASERPELARTQLGGQPPNSLSRSVSVYRSTSVPQLTRTNTDTTRRKPAVETITKCANSAALAKTNIDSPFKIRERRKHDTIASDHLNAELRAASLAMARLETSQDTKPDHTLPSYAKNTAASLRRSSWFRPNSSTNTRALPDLQASTRKQFNPSLPLNSFHSALF